MIIKVMKNFMKYTICMSGGMFIAYVYCILVLKQEKQEEILNLQNF